MPDKIYRKRRREEFIKSMQRKAKADLLKSKDKPFIGKTLKFANTLDSTYYLKKKNLLLHALQTIKY